MAAPRQPQQRGLLRRVLDALRERRRARLLAEYHAALDAMDWRYLFAKDSETFTRGKRLHERALSLQMKVDPTGEIWMSRPEAQRIGAARPVVVGGVR